MAYPPIPTLTGMSSGAVPYHGCAALRGGRV